MPVSNRPASLVASAPPEITVGDPLGDALSEAFKRFKTLKNPDQKVFAQMLNDVIGAAIEEDLNRFSDQLKARGLPEISEFDKHLAVKRALANTNDIRQRLLDAEHPAENKDPNKVAITAALGLPSFLSPGRLVGTIKSLFQSARDQLEVRLSNRLPQTTFTGRKRWVNPDGATGRYAKLHLQEVGPGEKWSIGARDVNGRKYPAQQIDQPRENPEDPYLWSNNRSYVQYQTVSGRWV